MSPSTVEYLRHMLDETNFLLNFAKRVTRDEFMKDEMYKRAFVRSVEVIGEAAKQISADIKRKYGYIEWRAIAGMRDKLIHGYFGVDFELVWDVVTEKIPELQREVIRIIEKESK